MAKAEVVLIGKEKVLIEFVGLVGGESSWSSDLSVHCIQMTSCCQDCTHCWNLFGVVSPQRLPNGSSEQKYLFFIIR